MRMSSVFFSILVILLFSAIASAGDFPCETRALSSDWLIHRAAGGADEGDAVSRRGFDCRDWIPASVPCTIMGALLANGKYPDWYVGRNLEKIDPEPFQGPWWYRREFEISKEQGEGRIRLILEGVNYRADVWLNGRRVCSEGECRGAFRVFSLDITEFAQAGINTLALKVFPPRPGDFTLGFVDWNPRSPDHNMGLFREVKLEISGPVSLQHPFVASRFPENDYSRAELSVEAELTNHSDRSLRTLVEGKIGRIRFSQEFELKGNEVRRILFTPEKFGELTLRHPRLWWPHDLGNPELYTLEMNAALVPGGDSRDAVVSDRKTVAFGIREIKDFINESGHRGYKVNGEKVLIRGGGWVDDLFLMEDEKKLEAQIAYCRHMNLNCIRLEGFWGSSQKLYDLADRYGILLMAGWSCQWEWEGYLGKKVDELYGGVLSNEDVELVSQYWQDQVRWLRNHPSIFVWVMASDLLPLPELEKRYRLILSRVDATRPALVSCKGHVSEVSGPSAVKMNGPYDYVPPAYWYLDKKNGGAFGFNTETGPGPQPPVLESILRIIPPDKLWPINDTWEYHCARNEFKDLKRFNTALEKRYGIPEDLEAYARMAQTANYEAVRAMFEAFRVNKFNATGVIQWMYNAAWPKMWWQLYDYFLLPTGAFYGTRKACLPLQAVYHHGDESVYLVNGSLQDRRDLRLEVTLLDESSQPFFSRALELESPANSSKKVFELKEISGNRFRFLDLKIKDKKGRPVADNFYWLAARDDVLDFDRSTWFYTPVREYADLSPLKKLPPVQVGIKTDWKQEGDERVLTLTLENGSDSIAFFLELAIEGGVDARDGNTIVPVFWEDNYISLLPGEKRILQARIPGEKWPGKEPRVRVSGWNFQSRDESD